MFRRRQGLVFLSIGFAIFVIYLVLSSPFQVLQEVGRLNWALFIMAVLIDETALIFFALSWYILLREMDVRISVLETVKDTFVSFFVVWLIPIPIGSEIIRAYLVRNNEHSNMGKAVTSVVVHKSMYNTAFGVLIALSAFIVTTTHGVINPVSDSLILFIILFAAGSSLFYLSILNPRFLRWIYSHSPSWIRTHLLDHMINPKIGLSSFFDIIDEVEKAVSKLKSKMQLNVAAFLMVAFHWSAGSITAFLVALSLGFRIDIWQIIMIYAIVEFIQQLNVLIPGGVGIIDAGLAGAFVLIGIPLASAAAISLLTRLATYWLEMVLCGAVSLHYGYAKALKDLI